ncbi:MMPL family transporter [Streptomyces sp. NPDC058221]|uniref:MMPL family transporter n=1 Tax=Streptomyces sp. NPDC058221 TaxID=3346388 RepID=UPI0036E5147D
MVSLTASVAVLCAGAAAGVQGRLVSGGFDAPQTQAFRADTYAAEHFGGGEAQLMLLVGTGAPVDAPAAAEEGRALTARLASSPGVLSVASYWDARDPLLRSRSGNSALVLAVLAGDEDQRVRTARVLVPELTGGQHGARVQAAGPAWMGAEAVDRTESDLLQAELLTAPLVFLLLVFAFRSLLAALLPVAVAAVSSVITLALLRPLASVMDLSTFSPNLTTALGFGLAVDYCLFLLTRFRRERATGLDVPSAVAASVRTAGRTVMFSVVTVALVMACLFAFPVPFLHSMAWAGITVAVCSGAVVAVLVPAVLLLAGARLADPRPAGDGSQRSRAGEWEFSAGWHRFAVLVCQRPAVWLAAALVLLSAMSLPLARLNVAPIDERTLPADASSHSAADQLSAGFPQLFPGATVVVTLPSSAPGTELKPYAAVLSRLPAVTAVDSAAGRYRDGRRIASAPAGFTHNAAGTWLAVHAGVDAAEPAARALVHDVRALPAPGGTVWVGGRGGPLQRHHERPAGRAGARSGVGRGLYGGPIAAVHP